MAREAVSDDVDLGTHGLQRNNLAQQGHKHLGGMAGGGLMGLKPSAPANPRDHYMIDSQRPRQFAAAQ